MTAVADLRAPLASSPRSLPAAATRSPAGAVTGATNGSAAGATTGLATYALLGLYAFGVNIEIKPYLLNGALLESLLRWLPGLTLSAALLVLHRPWRGMLASPVLLVLVLAIAQSTLHGIDPRRSLIEFVREMPIYLTAFAILAGSIREEQFWRTLTAASLAIAFGSVIAIAVDPASAWMNYEWGPAAWRLQGLMPQAVNLANCLGLALLLGGFFLLRKYEQRRMLRMVIAAGVLALTAWGFVAAGSRGPMIGIALALAVGVALAVARMSRRLRGMIAIILLLVLPLALMGMYIFIHALSVQSVLDFAISTNNPRMMTFVERALIWNDSRHLIAEAPIFGNGYRAGLQIDSFYANVDGFYPGTHSFFVAFWKECGIFALLAIIVIVTRLYVINAILAANGPLTGFACLRLLVLCYALGCALFDAPFTNASMMLALLCGYAFSVLRCTQRSP